MWLDGCLDIDPEGGKAKFREGDVVWLDDLDIEPEGANPKFREGDVWFKGACVNPEPAGGRI